MVENSVQCFTCEYDICLACVEMLGLNSPVLAEKPQKSAFEVEDKNQEFDIPLNPPMSDISEELFMEALVFMRESLKTNEKMVAAVKMLNTIVSKVVESPEEEKFRKLRLNHDKIMETITNNE